MFNNNFVKSISILIIAMFLIASFAPASAQEGPMQPEAVQKNSAANNVHLIPLDYPSLDGVEVPAGITRQSAARFIESLARKNAAQLLSELDRLQADGLVTRYKINPNLLAIEVETTQPEAVNEALGAKGAISGAATAAPSCLSKAGEALKSEVIVQSRVAQMSTTRPAPTSVDALATNPSIHVYTTPYGYSYISGWTNNSVSVTMKIIRGGKAVVTRNTSSRDDGYYYFRPVYNECPDNSYEWSARPGDTIEVSSSGGTASTVVAELSAWADPFNDVVAGKTAPGRIVETYVYQANGSSCDYTSYAKVTTANTGGDFSLYYSGTVNFNGRAQVDIYAYDANDNSTTTFIEAYHLGNDFGSGSVWGALKPFTAFNAERERGGVIEATDSGVSDPNGYFYAWLGDIQPGDILRVSGGGVTLQMTAAAFDAYLDPAANLLTGALGASGANRYVVADFENAWRITNTCNWYWSCSGAQANGAGTFSINPGRDILRGDDVYGSVYDGNGNSQYFSELTAPYINARINSTYINGYWRRGTSDPLTITHKDSANNIKWSGPVSYQDDWDGYFYGYSGSTQVAGDKIEVSDGVITEAMTVSNLSGRLNSLTGHLSGSASNGRLTAEIYDLQPPYYYYYTCAETTVNSGSYNLDLNATVDFGGWDEADLYNAGGDGHYTFLYRYTFSVSAEKDGTSVWGYSETPGANTNISLWRGGSQIASSNQVSSSDGYYGVGLSATILEGDELRVQTGDGNSANIVVPKLTVNISPGNSAIYGKAPANQGVETVAYRRYASNSTWGFWMDGPTNASGDYSVNYAGQYWWTNFSEGCYQIGVGGSCVWGRVGYYRPDGHYLRVSMAQSAPAAADGFENDDTALNASLIAGKQSHTFHQNNELDWVKFTVSQNDVDKQTAFHFITDNLGFGLDTVISLYNTDGATLLDEDDDSGAGLASHLAYTFSTPGTYYLRVRPYDPTYDTAYCDAKYDVSVTSIGYYLPLVVNQP